MVMPRLRRLCILSAICTFILYLGLAVWITEVDLESVFYNVWYINGFTNSSEAGEIACYYDANHSHNTLPELDPATTLNTSIFFLETSCPDTVGVHLTPRQACAVESAAKLNPNWDVYVLFPAPVVDIVAARSPSIQQLHTYTNVHLRHVSMDRYTQNTPLQQWYHSGRLRTSHWPRSHASDVLRYLTLWKFGGIYLDLDVVIIKSLTDIANFAGAESMEDVAAGVLSFSRDNIGHEMAEECLRDLRRDFRGYDWGHNGPGVITRALKRACGTENVREMTPERCKGFTVFPPEIFYPIPWRQWQLYFKVAHSEDTLRRVANSRAIHVWNKFSMQANVTVGSAQPYSIIASQYCPKVYTHVGEVF